MKYSGTVEELLFLAAAALVIYDHCTFLLVRTGTEIGEVFLFL